MEPMSTRFFSVVCPRFRGDSKWGYSAWPGSVALVSGSGWVAVCIRKG
jgi:hypothetical protein